MSDPMLPPARRSPVTARRRWAVGLLAVGSVLALLGLVGGVTARVWVDDGFYELATSDWDSDTAVFVAAAGDELADSSGLLQHQLVGDLRSRLAVAGGRDVFVGVTQRERAERLGRSLALGPDEDALRAAGIEPLDRTVWAASSRGPRPGHTVTWDPGADGALVVVALDGTSGLAIEATTSAELPFVTPAVYATTGAAAVALVLGSVLLIGVVRRGEPPAG